MTAPCDHRSVGILIYRGTDLLLFERATPPVGIAPPAGHVDQHGGHEQAACAEVAEEVGLTVTNLTEIGRGWRDNRCRRSTAGEVGHQWVIYRADTAGTVDPDPAEARNASWYTPIDVMALAARTADYAQGRITAAEFTARPGLEPVWVSWLIQAGVLPALWPSQIEAIDRLAHTGAPAN